MFRFSCFYSSVHTPKPKKTVQMSAEAMHKSLEDYSAKQPKKVVSLSMEVPEDPVHNGDESPSSIVQDWKSEGFKSTNDAESDETQKTGKMKKSRSLGSYLVDYSKGKTANECSVDESSSSHNDHSGSVVQADGKDPGTPFCDEYQKSDSLQISSNMVNHESVISSEHQQQSEKEGCENSETQFSGGDSGNHTPPAPRTIVKSSSMPSLRSSLTKLVRQSRSCEDLKALDSRGKDMSIENVERQVMQDQERDDDHVSNIDKSNAENPADDSYDAYHYVGSAKDWIVPAVDELRKGKSVQEDYSVCRWEELPNKDFKIKRIEKWVMDLQHCPLEETDVPTSSNHQGQNDINTGLDNLAGPRIDAKAILGLDSAKKYISSLSPSATSAQLTNHGLVVIPFLSAFASLKALNLSGNAIVRITAGALPRGLHILNLSKNSISIIEGLRELTRLRVLDLSYNRIIKIGHGLASCSSLKELYLAGNKISEVEGLHRLLKLNVLDLRFNKLSTTKSLGQLAANYNSLQAISLEANPAQKNIGDEQLKKYLVGLLPHLAYFNRQSIKAGTMKDTADRAARLGISAHQIERGQRSESKTLRKSTHGRKGQPVASRGRHARLPPAGTKTKTERQHLNEYASKLFSFRPDLALRRTRSEELLGAG